MVGELAGDEGYGEGDGFAIGGPGTIVVKLAGLGRVALVVDRAMAAQKERLMPGGAHVAGIRGEAHAQAQGGIGGAQTAQDVADLFLGVQG